jgi:hypothetical protein
MIEKLLNLDRRIIFALIAIMVAAPFFTRIVLAPGRNPRSQDLFNYIEDELDEGDVVVVSFSYGPASMPELNPMARAIIYHALSRNRRVLTMTLIPEGAILADNIVNEVGAELGKEKAVDYVNLGFQPGYIAVVLGMATDMSAVFKTDFEGTPYSKLEVTEDVQNYDDIALVVDLASSDTPATWIVQAHERYGVKIGAGVTAVMAQDYYPYLQAKQLVGMLNGLKGAAEYEAMVDHPGAAIRGMASQSLAQLLIIVMVIFVNIVYFVSRRRARQP